MRREIVDASQLELEDKVYQNLFVQQRREQNP